MVLTLVGHAYAERFICFILFDHHAPLRGNVNHFPILIAMPFLCSSAPTTKGVLASKSFASSKENLRGGPAQGSQE
jgi:hypothetical protein